MVFGDADDPTVPTGRAGVDPLLAFPRESTGQTGQIERPGDQTPWWFVPGLCAVAVFFIGLLATINNDRNSDRIAAEQQAAEPVPTQRAAPTVAAAPVDTDAVVDSAPVAPVTEVEVSTTVDPRVEELPAPGTVRVGTSEFSIVSRCEVQLPFEPADTEFQVSSYFFFDDEGQRQLIDRIFDGENERAQLLDDSQFVRLDEIGDAGAFSASFVAADGGQFDVTLNPAVDIEPQCGDRVVTNEPGQFTEPHTRIILDVCVDRTTDAFATVVGLTSEGGRFEILQAGGELGEIVFVERGAPAMRTTAPAFIIRSGNITSASGVVSVGADDLDIAIDIGNDVTEAEARTCVPSDRL